MTTELALKAVENAYQAQRPGPGLILHSDFESQYTSEKFAEYMERTSPNTPSVKKVTHTITPALSLSMQF